VTRLSRREEVLTVRRVTRLRRQPDAPDPDQLLFPPRILVVDDNDALREIATRILIRAGYEVTAAATRDEALRVSHDKNVRLDLVLTDVIMPGISVREFIDATHAARPGLPVVLMSGYATDHARTGDSLPDSFPMLAKPFQAATLLRQVSTTLAGS
jgi:CheY-like chemotaxis protein